MFEIRDPIHGFVQLSDWEREIINHPAFQRLRRIRQPGWTDMVYPGATHSRFEHSLGVMHIATSMHDHITESQHRFLRDQLTYNDAGLECDRALVRLTSLLHDVGHAPFSHAAEDLMPENPETQKPFRHEDFSAAVITHLMADVIEGHPQNQNFGIKAREIGDFLLGRATAGRALLWRELISSQLDADRADYLLRDSHHIGVAYGKFDLARLLSTLTVAMDDETDSPTLAVEEGGAHAAEGLILARYMMFTQVYFQHSRRAYDYHMIGAMRVLLELEHDAESSELVGMFPSPQSRESTESYVNWTDWRVLGLLSSGNGGEDGEILRSRRHHWRVYETPEVPNVEDIEEAQAVYDRVRGEGAFVDSAEASWYKFGDEDVKILLRESSSDNRLVPLSSRSTVIGGLRPISQRRIYVRYERKAHAEGLVREVRQIRRDGP